MMMKLGVYRLSAVMLHHTSQLPMRMVCHQCTAINSVMTDGQKCTQNEKGKIIIIVSKEKRKLLEQTRADVILTLTINETSHFMVKTT